MAMSEAKAEAISTAYMQHEKYEDIGKRIYPNAEFPRQTVYSALQRPTVKAKIAEKMGKVFKIEELQAINSRRIAQLDDTFKKRKKLTGKDAKLLSVENSIIETGIKAQGGFLQKSVNLTVVAQLQADQAAPMSNQQLIDSITNMIRDIPQQGRGDANMGNSTSLT